MAECKHTPSERAMKAAVEMEMHSALSTATVGKARALDVHFPSYDDLLNALKQAVANMAETLLQASGEPSDHDDVERFLAEGGSPSLNVYLSAISKAEGRSHD